MDHYYRPEVIERDYLLLMVKAKKKPWPITTVQLLHDVVFMYFQGKSCKSQTMLKNYRKMNI